MVRIKENDFFIHPDFPGQIFVVFKVIENYIFVVDIKRMSKPAKVNSSSLSEAKVIELTRLERLIYGF